MYLRRFKASPNACPVKQEQHRRRARARRIVTRPTSSTASSIRRMTSSFSDSSGTKASRKQKRLADGSSQQHDTNLCDSDQQDQDTQQHSGHDLGHQDSCHDHRAAHHKVNNDNRDQEEGQDQAKHDEEEEAYRHAGLQKPRRLGEGNHLLSSELQ